jgi:hypothetical protein
VLVDLGVLSSEELQLVVASRFSSVRVGVAGGTQVQLQGVMDCGVSPAALLDILKR